MATEKATEKYGNGYGCIWTHARNLAMGHLGSMHNIQGFSAKANNPFDLQGITLKIVFGACCPWIRYPCW